MLDNLNTNQFQSTPPRREVTRVGEWCGPHVRISIHTSPKGGDIQDDQIQAGHVISIHTSPKGGDRMQSRTRRSSSNFNPHLPEGR